MNRRGRAFDLLLLYFLYASVWVGVSESTLSTALNSARRMFVALKEKKKEKKVDRPTESCCTLHDESVENMYIMCVCDCTTAQNQSRRAWAMLNISKSIQLSTCDVPDVVIKAGAERKRKVSRSTERGS